MGTTYATKRRAHAKHNEEVYTHLKDNTEFTDWVITTAFYTAVHYVESFLFPYQDYDGSTLDTIHEYHNGNSFSSKHESRDQLVKEQMSPIHGAYKRLQNLSKTARYKDYEFTTHNSYSIVTEQKLKKIISYIEQQEISAED